MAYLEFYLFKLASQFKRNEKIGQKIISAKDSRAM